VLLDEGGDEGAFRNHLLAACAPEVERAARSCEPTPCAQRLGNFGVDEGDTPAVTIFRKRDHAVDVEFEAVKGRVIADR
jgi:hypothetical protein